MFQKVRRNRVFQDVVHQIQEAILDGRLKTGEKLPAERELVETFQTSRGTLREALRVLEQKGLIEVRMGVTGGAVVRDVGSDQMGEGLALLLRAQKVSVDDLGEFREAIEGHVAELAAQRAKPRDVRQLKAILTEAEKYCKEPATHRDDFLHTDQKFHMFLAKITGNPLFIFIIETLHDNIHRYYDDYLAMNAQQMQEDYQDLCQIVAAIEIGNAEQASRVARDHVERFARYMKNGNDRPEAPAGNEV
ncbi:MAG: FadR/GntR family transcriptional regulator [Syntrophobacteraceae bacterium]